MNFLHRTKIHRCVRQKTSQWTSEAIRRLCWLSFKQMSPKKIKISQTKIIGDRFVCRQSFPNWNAFWSIWREKWLPYGFRPISRHFRLKDHWTVFPNFSKLANVQNFLRNRFIIRKQTFLFVWTLFNLVFFGEEKTEK